MKIETPPSGQSQTKKELPSFVGDPPTERGFHVTRFEKMAKEYEDSIVQKVLHWNTKLSAIDFAQTEAIRDNADFERRKDKEFQAWEKNLRVVIDNLLEKRDQKKPHW